MLDIELIDRQSDVDLSVFIPLVRPIVEIVLKMEKTHANHISIQFLSDSTMKRYHKKYFNDGSSTDCMSFPLDEDPEDAIRCLGEILVCPKVALRHIHSNPEHGTVYSEIALYIIHGLLHLLGYDDIEEKDEALMRKKETQAMSLIEKTIKLP